MSVENDDGFIGVGVIKKGQKSGIIINLDDVEILDEDFGYSQLHKKKVDRVFRSKKWCESEFYYYKPLFKKDKTCTSCHVCCNKIELPSIRIEIARMNVWICSKCYENSKKDPSYGIKFPRD